MELNGLSRLDLVQDPGTGEDLLYYYKCIGEATIPIYIKEAGLHVLPRLYIWQPKEVKSE